MVRRTSFVSLAWPIQLVLWLSMLALVVILIALWTALDTWLFILLTVVTIASLWLALATSVFKVSLDDSRFTAGSLLGWPRLSVAVAEIESVRIVDVKPLGEFFGWGYRIRGVRDKGIITHGGAGLEIRSRDGSLITVTLSDAPAFAADLERHTLPG